MVTFMIRYFTDYSYFLVAGRSPGDENVLKK
jgi:hypothetical protein